VPADDTDATLVSDVSQETGVVSALPLASFGVAVAVRCVPTSRLADGGVTVTVATDGGCVVPPPPELSLEPPHASGSIDARIHIQRPCARTRGSCGMSLSPGMLRREAAPGMTKAARGESLP
jgi:hypothetical protein